jgi:hypothetical protein
MQDLAKGCKGTFSTGLTSPVEISELSGLSLPPWHLLMPEMSNFVAAPGPDSARLNL